MNVEHESSEIMTLSQAAAYLQLAEKTVLRMAQRAEVPAAKIASQWRFLRPVLRDWVAGQMQMLPAERIGKVAGARHEILSVHEIVRPGLVTLDIKPGTKDAVLGQLVDTLVRSGFTSHGPRLLRALVEREEMMSTALGHRIAIPHPRKALSGVFREPAIAVGICPEGTDFDAVDDQRVNVFYLICATRDEVHLRLMAVAGWLARNEKLVDELRAAASREAVAAGVCRSGDALA